MQRRKVSRRNGTSPRRWTLCYPALVAGPLLCAFAQVADLRTRVRPRPVQSFASTQSLSAGSGAARGEWPAEQWWLAYGDPQLVQLIEEALANAPSMAQAGARLREAAARAGLAGAARMPVLGLNA